MMHHQNQQYNILIHYTQQIYLKIFCCCLSQSLVGENWYFYETLALMKELSKKSTTRQNLSAWKKMFSLSASECIASFAKKEQTCRLPDLELSKNKNFFSKMAEEGDFFAFSYFLIVGCECERAWVSVCQQMWMEVEGKERKSVCVRESGVWR